MSGGHFDYDQYRLSGMAEKIRTVIEENDTTDWYNYSPETIAEFEKAISLLDQAYVYAQRIDWLVSSDDSEITFHKRLAEDLKSLNNN